MKSCKLAAIAALCAAGALAAAGVTKADTVNNVGATLAAPAGGQVVIAGNPIDGNGNSSGGTLNYYNNAWAGETFTTGNNAAGYQLNSIAVYDQYEQGAGWASGVTETMNVFTPGAANMLYTGTGTVGTAGASGNWIVYTFSTPVTLAANTLYAYSENVSSGYSAMGLTVGNGTSSGTGSASSQLATFASGTSTAPTYWTGAGWGSNPAAAPVSSTNDPTDVFTDNAEFQIVGTPVVATPEPAALGLLAVGGLGFLLRRSRKLV